MNYLTLLYLLQRLCNNTFNKRLIVRGQLGMMRKWFSILYVIVPAHAWRDWKHNDKPQLGQLVSKPRFKQATLESKCEILWWSYAVEDTINLNITAKH
jgi:hypothetical protein